MDEDQDRFRVLPVLDSCDADEWCTLLSAPASGGLGDMAVSTALESTIPRSVLDARVGRLPDMAPITRLRTDTMAPDGKGRSGPKAAPPCLDGDRRSSRQGLI